jgi:DNA-binding NarL/FixJ family response regulator
VSSARVALVGLPEMLREIVAGALASASDLTLVGSEDEVERAVERLDANVLVVTEDVLAGEATAELLRDHPEIHVLGLSEDGRRAYIRSGERRVLLGGLSPEALREALQGRETA